ncbi:MAG: 16S rRNA (guanine(527)-N(7))-methyltransferase RsmG [Anaeroplasmataceae bacterium]
MNFKDELKTLNIELTPDMQEKFDIYYKFLVEYNKFVNLTAITDHDEVFIKHFYDSLILTTELPKEKISLCDVGAGAGFPSVPCAIYNKDINVTIVDSLNKRIVFLNELVKKLNINNVSAIHNRAEDFATDYREAFDVVTARAVARLNILVELCLPLVKVGGIFIALKSTDGDAELSEALNAINILGGKVIKSNEFELPYNMGQRKLIVIEKIKECPKKYPRQFSVIKNKPL